MNIFLCHVPFHYFVLKSIYKHLNKSYFAIPPLQDKLLTDEFGGGLSKKGQCDYLKDFLNKKNVEVINYGERTPEKFAEFLDANCDNVITPHWFSGINHIHNTRIVRMMYGLANKESSTYSIVNNLLMDLVLTFGDNSVKRFLTMGLQAEAVGNPIFDDWFNDSIDLDNLECLKRRLEYKQTILYLPTFAKFSSIEKFIDTIISLSDKYNIIVKLHHATFTGEANRLCRILSHPELIVLGDYFDSQSLFKLADIVLVENSGAVYDALLLEKPVIMLGALLGNDGYDIYDERDSSKIVKKSEIIPSTSNPLELEKLVKKNIGKISHLNEDIKHSLFFKPDGCAGKRAAEAILDDRKYPAIPAQEMDEKTRNYILNERNNFTNKNHNKPLKKPNLIKRVLNRLSFG